MANFFAELKRRNRVDAAYAVVAWFLIQLVSNIFVKLTRRNIHRSVADFAVSVT